MNFVFSRDECLNLEKSLRCEWLETNGLGGFAASTILNCHSRKYHGLLVAPVPELNKKFVLLSKLEPALLVDGKVFNLSTNKYPDVFHPTGHKYIDNFQCELYPISRFRMGDIQFEQSVLMPQGENTVLIKYELITSARPVILHLKPLLAYREIHQLTRENIFLRVKTYVHDHFYKIDPYDGMPPLFFDVSKQGIFYPGPHWYHNLEYLKERSRGFDYQEDLFCPGVIEITLKESDTVYFRASLATPETTPHEIWDRELRRRKKVLDHFAGDPFPINLLKYRASQFLITNPQKKRSIIAGYPWFDEWGRDAMIAIPGLTFYCQRSEEGFAVLKTFAAKEKDGLIPNFFSVNGQVCAYNAVDPSLWFFWAIQEYLKHTGDLAGVREHLLPVMGHILKAFSSDHIKDVGLHTNGLLWVGSPHTQLTWMDATVHGQPVTPRHGYAVEINALWFNALSFFKKFTTELKIKTDLNLADMIQRCKKGFLEAFWVGERQYLADCVNDCGQDVAIRPNQIFAVSLPFSPLTAEQKRLVMNCVKEHLVTPYGLRTLSPTDPHYHSVYSGSVAQRDGAYHQGTVWPWLTGHYCEALLKVSHEHTKTKRELAEGFAPLFGSHLRDVCQGGISEIFNGNPPHDAKGCFHQAWSVAEVIRAHTLVKEAL